MRKNIKHVLAAALTVSLGFAGTAVAATSTLNSSLAFNNRNVASFRDTIASGFADFNDTFAFTTSANIGGAYATASFNGINFTAGFSAFNLLDITHGNLLVVKGTVSPSFLGTLTFSGLNSNITYGLNIVGKVANPSVGASYSGSIAVMSMPVPEPGEYALMLCGLGMIALVAVYRRQEPGFLAAC